MPTPPFGVIFETDVLEVLEVAEAEAVPAWTALQQQAGALAQQWRMRVQPENGQPLAIALDGWVEDFVVRVGQAIATGQDWNDWAWCNSRGLIRLPLLDGAARLTREFAVLRHVLETWAATQDVEPGSLRRLEALLAAARMHTINQLHQRLGLGGAGRVPVGVLLVEVK